MFIDQAHQITLVGTYLWICCALVKCITFSFVSKYARM